MVNWHPLGTIWHPFEGAGRTKTYPNFYRFWKFLSFSEGKKHHDSSNILTKETTPLSYRFFKNISTQNNTWGKTKSQPEWKKTATPPNKPTLLTAKNKQIGSFFSCLAPKNPWSLWPRCHHLALCYLRCHNARVVVAGGLCGRRGGHWVLEGYLVVEL